MTFEVGDVVETTYTNITNKIGQIIAIYDKSVTIMGMEGEMSAHKKERLKLVRNDEVSIDGSDGNDASHIRNND